MYCVISNCHNSVVSKDFLVLFTSYNLAKGKHFYGKNQKIEFSGVRLVFSRVGSYALSYLTQSCDLIDQVLAVEKWPFIFLKRPPHLCQSYSTSTLVELL